MLDIIEKIECIEYEDKCSLLSVITDIHVKIKDYD